MDEATFQGQRAGHWEFTFEGPVRDFRAAELAFTGTDGEPAAGVAVQAGPGWCTSLTVHHPGPSPAQYQVSDRARAMRAPVSKSS